MDDTITKLVVTKETGETEVWDLIESALLDPAVYVGTKYFVRAGKTIGPVHAGIQLGTAGFTVIVVWNVATFGHSPWIWTCCVNLMGTEDALVIRDFIRKNSKQTIKWLKEDFEDKFARSCKVAP